MGWLISAREASGVGETGNGSGFPATQNQGRNGLRRARDHRAFLPFDVIIVSNPMPIMTGLSGNEMYCLHLKGLKPGELVIGNSVHSLGFLGGIGAGLQGMIGGEGT